MVSDLLCLDTTDKISRKLHTWYIECLRLFQHQILMSTVRCAIDRWNLHLAFLHLFLLTFSHRPKKGRNFRGQKFLRFRKFWPIPRNFMSMKFFKIGHTRNLMSIRFFKIGYMRKFMSVKFKYWPPAEDFVRKVFAKYTSPHEVFKSIIFSNNVDSVKLQQKFLILTF